MLPVEFLVLIYVKKYFWCMDVIKVESCRLISLMKIYSNHLRNELNIESNSVQMYKKELPTRNTTSKWNLVHIPGNA